MIAFFQCCEYGRSTRSNLLLYTNLQLKFNLLCYQASKMSKVGALKFSLFFILEEKESELFNLGNDSRFLCCVWIVE